MQLKLSDFVNELRKVGSGINENKFVLTINCEENLILKATDIPLEAIEKFPYLGSIVSGDEETTIDISKRKNKAKGVFANMRSVWRSKKTEAEDKKYIVGYSIQN